MRASLPQDSVPSQPSEEEEGLDEELDPANQVRGCLHDCYLHTDQTAILVLIANNDHNVHMRRFQAIIEMP
jgi:sulfur transfer protein SufE